MEIEEIEDNSSQDALSPAATILPAKKRTIKTRKDNKKNSIAPPSSTLTRFLGPRGTPSTSVWEDANRQCPVCQQGGFSSRSLAFHVNDCLDGRNGSRADVGESTVRAKEQGQGATTAAVLAEATQGRSNPSSCSPRTTGERAGINPRTGGSGDRKGTGRVSRESSRTTKSGTTAVVVVDNTGTGERVHRPSKTPHMAAKTASSRQGPSRTAERSGPVRTKADSAQNRRQLKDKTRSDGRSREPRLPSPTNRSPTGVAQPASARRRGLLSRPRGSQMVRDSTPVSAAETTREQTGSEEHALDQIARAQLLHVLEAFGDGTARGNGWLGTNLLPKATPKDALNSDGPCHGCGSGGEGSDGCVGGCGRGVGREELRVIGDGNRRVRARPASWGTRPSVERRGRLGFWQDGGDDDCWGDGDGHVMLRRFPSREVVAEAGVREENGEGKASPILDAQASSKEGKVPTSSSSRTDRFLGVFARLQPARRALNVEEPPLVSSGDGERTEGSCAGLPRGPCVGSLSSRAQPRDLLRGDSATATPAVGVGGCKAGAEVGNHGAAEEMTAGGMDASSSKRKAVATSSDSKRRTSGGMAVGSRRVQDVQETADINHCASPSSQRSLSPEIVRPRSPEPALEHEPRREPPAIHLRTHRQPAERPSEPLQVGEVKRVGSEACKREATSKTPSLPVQTTSRVGGSPGLDPATGDAWDAPAGKRQAPKIVEAALKENSGPNHLPAAWDREGAKHSAAVAPPADRASSTRQNLSAIAVQRDSMVPTASHLEETTARRTQQQPSRRRWPGGSEDVTGRVAGASAANLRGSDSNANAVLGPTADLNGTRRSQGGSKLGVEPARAVSYHPKSGGKQAAIIRQVSSGLLTSAGGARLDSRNGESRERRPIAFAPIESEWAAVPLDMPAEPAPSEASQAACQGHEADVAQKGSLTVVDPDHGATLRSSWSIDDSEELGKLEFGFSLDYDAVWYLPPADAGCVGVLRYRVVPHADLAPSGGWISERGRFQEDPYIIAKATPATRPRPSHLATDPLSSSSNRRRQQAERPARGVGVGGVHRSKSRQDPSANPEQSRIADENDGTRSSRGAAGNRQPPAASQHGHAVRPGTSNENSQRRDHHRPRRKESGDHQPADVAAGGSRRVQPASTSGREDAPAKGSLGLLPSPSAKVLPINDTGDKVRCPVCQRGMDHWKSGQRQQHVHVCLLKQPSSAKKPSPAAVATVDIADTTRRAAGSTHRPSVRDFAMEENGSAFPTPTRESSLPDQRLSATDGEKGPASSERSRRFPDPAGSPRPTRVSLQGVFSPKPAPGPNRTDGRSRAAGHRHDTASAGGVAAPAAGRRSSYPIGQIEPGAKQGMRASGDSAPRKNTVGGTPAKKAVSGTEGLSECPVCRLNFEGRQGQWERQAHVQQCLDSMESVFDSEELL